MSGIDSDVNPSDWSGTEFSKSPSTFTSAFLIHRQEAVPWKRVMNNCRKKLSSVVAEAQRRKGMFRRAQGRSLFFCSRLFADCRLPGPGSKQVQETSEIRREDFGHGLFVQHIQFLLAR